MARRLSSVAFNWKYSNCFFVSVKKYCSQTKIKTENHALKDEIKKLSTLFVPGRHGADMYQIVKPLIDVDFISDNLGKLKLSCDHRGIDLDLDYVLELALKWLDVRNDYIALTKKDQQFMEELANLNSLSPREGFESSKEREKHLEILIACKTELHDIEDLLMPLLQKIPHFLHPDTPLQFDIIDVCEKPPALELDVKSHIEIGRRYSQVEFFNNLSTSYFLTGRLSELDLAIQMYFNDKMSTFGFLPLSCMDFCKSFIIEAIGFDPYSSLDCIQLKSKRDKEVGQKLNLVGGASFETFCAYLTNMNVAESTLPLKYYSLGRRYNAANKNTEENNLFSVVQSTNVHCIILSEQPSDNEFNILLQSIITCFSDLCVPYRIVNISAKNLTVAESYRKQLELWSPSLKEYVPIAYVSQHDDFISKRLSITYGIQHIKDGYCSIIEGAVVNTSILIGCIIENFQTKDSNFNIPEVLKSCIASLHK